MKCKSPILLAKFGDVYRPATSPYGAFFVPCRKCLYCRIQRRREWTIKCIAEKQTTPVSTFVTLTYNDENYTPTLIPEDLQLFMKRLRKFYKTRIRFYAAGEYGEKSGRAHYHLILFGFTDVLDPVTNSSPIIEDCWTDGYNYCGSVTQHSIRYVAQYIDKKFYGTPDAVNEHYGGRVPEFQRYSKGLGSDFFLANLDRMRYDGYIVDSKGIKHGLPRWVVNRIAIGPHGEAFLAERRERSIETMMELTGGMLLEDMDSDDVVNLYSELRRRGAVLDLDLRSRLKVYKKEGKL